MTRPAQPLHTREEFDFTVEAPLDVAWPLFGAEGERAWADDWHPRFVWPSVAADQHGMVFTVAHGHATAVWVNTCFDRGANRIQYVYFLPDAFVTVITLALSPSRKATHVGVVYERTALTPTANDTVRRLAATDKGSAPHWCRQIKQHLRPRP